jgi:two-component system response regulator DevR
MTSTTVTPISVLVVDDSIIVRQGLCDLLAEDDCIAIVGEAGSVAEACRLFEQHRPDAVVLDIQLPDGSGLEVLRRIKQTAPSCMVIVLTNFRESAFRWECLRSGADHFLHKAMEFERVAELLHRRACGPPCPSPPQQTWPPPRPTPPGAPRSEEQIA